MDIKPRLNHSRYLEILRKMTPEQKVCKVFELNALGKEFALAGIRARHPEMTDREVHETYLKSVGICHNRNY